MDDVYPQTAVLVRLAVERVAADPADEQRYLELNFALDRAVERNLRYRELLALFAEGAMAAASETSWAWRLAAGLGANLMGDSAAAIRWLQDAHHDLASGGRLETAAGAFVYGELARGHYHFGDHLAGLEAANRALQLARGANSPLAEAYAHHYLGLISLRKRDLDYAQRHITLALELFEWMNQRQGRARVLDSLAALRIEHGEYDSARKLLEESLKVKEELRDLRGQALTCGNLAQIFTAHGDYPQAMHYLDRTRALVARVGDERNATLLRVRVGELHLRHQNPGLACEELLAARALAAGRNDARLEAHACFALAQARGQLGDRIGALEAVSHAYDYFVTHDDSVMRDRAAVRRIVLQEEPSLEALQEPLDRLRAAEPGDALAEALFEAATALRNRGFAQQVIALYAEALDVAEPFLADQFATAMRGRSESAEARSWVDAMLMVKQHKDRLEDAYSRLRRAETLRESLTQMIVHDLKNPLTAILPWLETIQSGVLTQEETGEALTTVIDECDYLLRMIEDLNDVGKAQSDGKVDVVKEWLDLGQLITTVAERLSGRAREVGMSIVVQVRSPLPQIAADPEKLRRVLENLVANGIKYGKPPPESDCADPEVKICVLIEAPGPGRDYETVRVEVRDNGMGIPLAEADRVFEPYYQAEAGRRRKAGVGLGLAFCRMVINAHNGSIWTQPGPSGGSVFVFRLPVGTA